MRHGTSTFWLPNAGGRRESKIRAIVKRSATGAKFADPRELEKCEHSDSKRHHCPVRWALTQIDYGAQAL
jgi:hypothetical protein